MSRRRELALLWGIAAVSVLSRSFVASRLELSDQEALLWARSVAWPGAAPPILPGALVELGTASLGQTELGVRLPGILLSTAVMLLVAAPARERVLTMLILASMPLFAVGGLFASPELYLGSALALVLLAAARERWGFAGLGALAALLCVPRDGSPFPTGPDPAALAVSALFWVTPVLLGAGLAWWARRGKGDPTDRALWWGSWPLLIPAIWGWPTAGGAAWVGVALGLGRAGGRLSRAGWMGSGVAGFISLAMLIHLLNPLVDLSGDPRVQLAGGRVLASSVSAWGAPLVLTEERADAALLRFYGVPQVYALEDAGRMVERAEQALVVRPWRGGAELGLLREGFDTDGPNDVAAYIDTTDPLTPRLAARWQVYEVHRAQTRGSSVSSPAEEPPR